MKRVQVLSRLSGERSRLKDLKVKSLAVFGSVARDEARTDSDVDILVEFDGAATFERYMNLKDFLEQVLENRVDLLTRKSIRPELRPNVERDAVNVA